MNNIIQQSTLLSQINTTLPTLALYTLSSTSLQDNKPIASLLADIVSSADTTSSPIYQGVQHQQRRMMTVAYSMPSPANTMSPQLYSRSRTTPHAGRPQRPGPSRPPQPRDGDTRHMFSSLNSNSFSARRDPQPRDPGNGRMSRGPQPRDPGGRSKPKDPQPRDPGM